MYNCAKYENTALYREQGCILLQILVDSPILYTCVTALWNKCSAQELLKEAGLLGKLECFQLEAEKLAEVLPFCPIFAAFLPILLLLAYYSLDNLAR